MLFFSSLHLYPTLEGAPQMAAKMGTVTCLHVHTPAHLHVPPVAFTHLLTHTPAYAVASELRAAFPDGPGEEWLADDRTDCGGARRSDLAVLTGVTSRRYSGKAV